ncbi:Uncharacterized conserved protein, DUF1330 family [Pseudomonas peli]|jgi:uncharacterized protein (DUF1330 family)|uniref:Uncharacterized conserved protein, DUF1330 family n=1 Tax=Pseudomonas peli TaxID=592361 RepID=A0AB37ZEP6_9PSED|nr:DUF1330 domain-containing protein [Pseudomonas peli]NMZ67650.1 DUF1330 domain-containing protein [Pseudomonas peli]SCW76090.1 Uncharacterized conserved protein, DUF1330 family [Pseudomonas peli]|tara:strand:+ start:7099 stop:7503 length:405 start_codon:yes stop_codon:yes gene_type:complete
MPSINPSPAQLAAFSAAVADDTPLLMLNLLRFQAQASYSSGSSHIPCSGREAYARYSQTALRKVRGVGGEVQVMAAAQAALIAPEGEQWDELLLVRYPSKAAFLSMLADPEYRAATEHRTAALADSRLIATTPR